MRVLALVTDGFGGFGGIARYNEVFLGALAQAGAELVVLPRSGNPSSAPEGVAQLPARAGKIGFVFALLRLMQRDSGFDLIWCGHVYMAPVAALAARVLRRPWWLQIYGVDAWERLGFFIRWAVARAALVTSISRYTRRRFLSWADLPPHRVRVLPNCVDPKFTPGPRPGHLLARYGLEGRRILLTISRLSAAERYKGHDRVIRLLPELATEFPDIAYVFGGDGDDRPRLEALADQLSVRERCHFIGRIAEEEIVEHHRMADIFVMPSTGEGFGIVFLEAMACGVPVIGLAAGGAIDVLVDGKMGHAVTEADLFSGMTRAMSQDAASRWTLSEKVRIHFGRERFARNAERIADRLMEAIA